MAVGVKKDEYQLGQSATKTITGLAEEIRIDLSLNPNPHLNEGTIYGTVTDELGNPIPDVLIKIMDRDHNPLAHTLTAADGGYIFSPFSSGDEYHLYAVKPGYFMGEALPFPLLPNQSVKKDFTLVLDPDSVLSIIAGEVKSTEGTPIGGAVVELYSVDMVGTETLLALSFTNEYGQYVFRELSQGNYIVRITALGYKPTSAAVTIDQPTSIAKVINTMEVDPAAAKGTISGIITDDEGNSISGADVILYKVEQDESLTPIAYTKTNDEGLYLFIKVPKGNYKIKSNKTIIIV